MKPLIGFGESQKLDARTTEEYSLSADLLMEAAAIGMVAALEADPELRAAMDSGPVRVAAVCGGGNNGGDALAVLRRLAFSGRTGLVAVVAATMGQCAAQRLEEARRSGVNIVRADDKEAVSIVAGAGLVLDGCTGVGLRGPCRPELALLLSLVSRARGPVVAIDVPSGLGPLAAAGSDPPEPPRARVTLCVEPLKAELYYPGNRPFAGRIVPVSAVFHHAAGSGSRIRLLEERDLAGFLPGLDPDGHKGTRGALGLCAGSGGSTGAAVLAARAAQAAGAGSVTVLTRESVVPVLSSLLVSPMVRTASDPGARKYTAFAAGPGWGLDEAKDRELDRLWNSSAPLLLDADALSLLARAPRPPRCSPLVLTPHPGEFAPLAAIAGGGAGDDPDALERARRRARYDTATLLGEVAARFNAVVVFKGAVTWIGDPGGRLAVWDGRDPGLATAGSGDVLAGLAAGFLARGAAAWDAATAAVIVHALAGRAASAGGFYVAEDLIKESARLSFREVGDGNS